MYKNLVEINDNLGIATEENGNVKIVLKDNNEKDFEQILNSINEVDKIKKAMNSINKRIKNKKTKNIISFTIYVLLIGIISFLWFRYGYAMNLRYFLSELFHTTPSIISFPLGFIEGFLISFITTKIFKNKLLALNNLKSKKNEIFDRYNYLIKSSSKAKEKTNLRILSTPTNSRKAQAESAKFKYVFSDDKYKKEYQILPLDEKTIVTNGIKVLRLINNK